MPFSQTNPIKRFVTAYAGTVIGKNSDMSSYGNLPSTLPDSLKSLESLKSYISVISNLDLPTYFSGVHHQHQPIHI